jgi:hypothetical protein
MEITKYVTLKTLCFNPWKLGCHCWTPTTKQLTHMKRQNRNWLCSHIFDWPVCLASVFTSCEFQMLAMNFLFGLITEEMKIMVDLSNRI